VEADSVRYRLSVIICQGTAVIGPERRVARDHFEAWWEGYDGSVIASWCWCFLAVSVISDQFSRASAYLESRLSSRSLELPQKYHCCGHSIIEASSTLIYRPGLHKRNSSMLVGLCCPSTSSCLTPVSIVQFTATINDLARPAHFWSRIRQLTASASKLVNVSRDLVWGEYRVYSPCLYHTASLSPKCVTLCD
jgi:hypothetical protein